VAAAALAAGGLVATATPAQAEYHDCWNTEFAGKREVIVSCWGRGAQWRAFVDCDSGANDQYVQWTWLSRTRQYSTVKCGIGAFGPGYVRKVQFQFQNVN